MTRYRRYVRDDANVSKIAKFICDSIEDLVRFENYPFGNDLASPCYHYNIDGEFEIGLGWASGYGDKKRDDVIQSEHDPDYAINVGVKKYNPNETDFEWLESPIVNGEPYYVEVSVDKTDLRNGCTNVASYLVKEYNHIIEENEKSNTKTDSLRKRRYRR